MFAWIYAAAGERCGERKQWLDGTEGDCIEFNTFPDCRACLPSLLNCKWLVVTEPEESKALKACVRWMRRRRSKRSPDSLMDYNRAFLLLLLIMMDATAIPGHYRYMAEYFLLNCALVEASRCTGNT